MGAWIDMFGLALYFLTVAAIPIIFQFLCKEFKFFDFLGVTICCFLVGILVGNIFPRNWINKGLVDELANIMVPLGIILMLLSSNIKKWIKISFKVLFAYFLSLIGVLIVSIVLFFVFDQRNDLKYVSGMLTGTYVGGTPNMAAVKIAFGIPENFYNQIFLCDVLASSVYLLFIMVFAQRMLSVILKKYKPIEVSVEDAEEANIENYSNLIKPAIQILKGIGLSIVVFAIPVVLWILFNGSMQNMSMVFVILSITVLAVAFSFIPVIRNNAWNYKTGDYIFSVFFTMLGTLTYAKDLYHIKPTYILYTFIFLFGSVLIHIILCRIFKIDRDTMIITSAAGIMSPPFIPAISKAIKNKDLLVPGIAVGIIGLAAGNVLGIFVVKLLMRFVS